MHSQPLPAHISMFNDIIDELNVVVHSKTDELSLARKLRDIQKKATDLQNLNVPVGLSALGSVAAARGQWDLMHKYHKRSLQFVQEDVLILNYAVSMSYAGQFLDAINLIMTIYDSIKGDEKVLGSLVQWAFAAKDEKRFVQFSQAYRNVTGREHNLFIEYLEELDEIEKLTDVCTTLSAETFLASHE